MLFIENQSVFLSLPKLDSNLILNILKKYYSKYEIFILILDNKDYDKLIKIAKINLLKNVRIISIEDLQRFDIEILRNNNLYLKNS